MGGTSVVAQQSGQPLPQLQGYQSGADVGGKGDGEGNTHQPLALCSPVCIF